MGIEERRKTKELQDQTLPAREQEIADICGATVRYDVDWPSFADDGEALRYLDNTACHRLNMALRMVCTDDLAREAVRDGLKVVRVRNVADPGQMQIALTDDVLDIHGTFARPGDGCPSHIQLRDLLLARL